MVEHEPFNFKTGEDLLRKAAELGVDLPFQESVDPLFEPATVGSKRVPNRMAVQPMEGFDGQPDGSPGELTFRRYLRYAEGGSGLIWFEATAVIQEGRSNPRQLLINRKTLDGFSKLIDDTRRAAQGAFGDSHNPYLVLQLTHSGRFSCPEGKPINKAACLNPHLDREDVHYALFSDAELDRLKDIFVEAAGLAQEAGFDAVDVKACHGYLAHELLGAHTRTESRYGGDFENRARFLLDLVELAQSEYPQLDIAVRLNATDGIPHPYGFGVADDGSAGIDLSEPKLLVNRLKEKGCSLLNITAGVPYHSPFVGRPFNRPVAGTDRSPEHPLRGVCRLMELASEFQTEFADLPVVGTGYSWLREFWPQVGASVLARKMASFIGLGRGSFAYPGAPRDLMDTGTLGAKKCCISCSRCTELTRHFKSTGCVIRDRDIYRKIYETLEAS